MKNLFRLTGECPQPDLLLDLGLAQCLFCCSYEGLAPTLA
jgi:hypothetical protein